MNVEEELRKKHYGVYKDSAVQVCHWTKSSLRGKGACYKEKFYGIDSHRCMQFSPVTGCQERCNFCWRPLEIYNKNDEETEDPEEMIERLIGERKKLLSGFGSSVKDKRKLKESKIPNLFTFSLIGEPTSYPKLPEAIDYIKRKYGDSIIFLVTNGQEPDMVKKLIERGLMPTQFTLSVVAGNEELFKKITNPLYGDAWERFNKTIGLFKDIKSRKLFRINVIKGINDNDEEIYQISKLIEKASPDFIHVKGYSHLGHSRKILNIKNEPSHEEINKISRKITEFSKDYDIINESEVSRVVLLKNRNSKFETKIR